MKQDIIRSDALVHIDRLNGRPSEVAVQVKVARLAPQRLRTA